MFAILLLLLVPLYAANKLGYATCHATCATCWGPDIDNCYTCTTASYFLQNWKCQLACDSPYIGDPMDKICKKSRNYNEYPCPRGTYNKVEYSTSISACILCEGGNACENLGMSAVGSGCEPGFQCPAGALFSKYLGSDATVITKKCVAGTYSPGESATCLPCPAGKYCYIDVLSAPSGNCPAGYFCSGGAFLIYPTNEGTQGGRRCAAGYYCISGTASETKCPEGTYRDVDGGVDLTSCFTCPPGYYCSGEAQTAITGPCDPGYYCPAGSITKNPASSVCPPGYKCPASTGAGLPGSVDKIPCEPGYYQDLAGQTTCTLCPAGSYIDFDENKAKSCLAGYYCLSGNKMLPCPNGKYNSLAGQSVSTICLSCTAGYACEVPGTSNDKAIKCAAGYYCPAGASSRYQIQCEVGYYCPEGSANHKACDAGKYCLGVQNSAPTGICPEGFYCPSATQKSEQNICPKGSYCPIGSSTPTPCPIGTFGPLFGATKAEDCISCALGDYCDSTGIIYPSLNCAGGYYCPRKQTDQTPDLYVCPAGYYCPPNSIDKKICPYGYYQPDRGQTSCIQCPAGYYCDGSDTTKKADCPQGYYCPLGTIIPVPCPIGTYNDKTLSSSDGDCSDCAEGFYCPNRGQAYSVDECPQGYYCDAAAEYPDWKACPISKFCPSGTSTPFNCPDGTYLDSGYAFDYLDCTPCTPGYYCIGEGKTLNGLEAGNGVTTTYMPCDAGYYCSQGSSIATPVGMDGIGDLCTAGHYCPQGSKTPIKCPIGSFSRQTGLSVCDTCTAGYYCPNDGNTSPTSCSTSMYCPLGSGIQYPCPPGTLSLRTNVAAAASCSPCTLGNYCELYATTAATPCPAGFICISSKDEMPMKSYDSAVSTDSKCPPGSYCPSPSYSAKMCEPETYQNSEGATTCKECPRGYYCEGYGVISPVLCEAGYLCSGSSSTPTPTSVTGMKCTPNHFCPMGTATEVLCPDGYFTLKSGAESCDLCSEGYVCQVSAGTIEKVECPSYHYCLKGSSYSGNICEPGTYTTDGITKLRKAKDCLDCPTGYYCIDGGMGLTGVNLKCIAGYLCTAKADSPKPNIVGYAIPCPEGGYCVEAASTVTPCPTGKVRGLPGGRQEGDCSSCEAGYYCITNDPIPHPCPVGYYCPLNSEYPKECPYYTYSMDIKVDLKYKCDSCPAGYYCDSTKISDISNKGCPVSHFCGERCMSPITCPGGTYIPKSLTGQSSGDCIICPTGKYCPMNSTYEEPPECEAVENPYAEECNGGAIKPFLCQAGYYCKYTKTDSDIRLIKGKCPYNFYCPEGTADPIACPEEYICLEGAIYPTLCPFGTFMRTPKPTTAATVADACYLCGPGYYSGNGTCLPCASGYVCLGNTFNKYPTDKVNDNGYECPPGYYCPEGSYEETPCPVATFRSLKKGRSISDCTPCDTDSYNDLTGQFGCKKCGPNAGSNSGATTCKCIGEYREFHKSDSSCRCIAGYYFMVNGLVSKVDDSSENCIPIVEEKCQKGQMLDFEHKCVSTTNCTKMCPSGGKYSATSKICICDTVAQITCDASCKSSQPQATFVNPTTMQITDPTTGTISYVSITQKSSVYVGSTIVSNKPVKSVQLGASGQFKGTYGTLATFQNLRRRRLDDSATVANPVICSTIGESIAFGISSDHYPVYLKDSLLNTVKDFDYAPFTTLEQRIKSSIETTAFVFAFTIAGTYHFADSSDNEMQMILKVKAEGDACPTDFILPFSDENLASMGVKPRTDILRSHKLYLYLLLLGAMLIAISSMIILVEFIKPSFFDFIDTSKQNKFDYDRKKFAALEDDDKQKKLKEMIEKRVKGADILVLKEMKNKLNDLDEKMREALKNGQSDRRGKLKDLCDRISDLNKIIQQHYNSLVLPTGNTIDNALSPYENGVNKDTDYESILTQNSEKQSSSSEVEVNEEIKSHHSEGHEEERTKPKGENEEEIIQKMEEEKNSAEQKDFEEQNQKMKTKLNQEFDSKKEKIRGLLQTEDNDIKELIEDFTSKIGKAKAQLEEELQSKAAEQEIKLKERIELRKKGNAMIIELKKKTEEDKSNFKSANKDKKAELKTELKLIDTKIEDMKREGFKKLDEEENKQFTELRNQFKADIAKESEQGKVDKLLHDHEVERSRLEEFLRSERKRQQDDIDKRLKEKRDMLRKDVVDKYKIDRDGLKRNHELAQSKINQVKFMAIVDHGLQPVDVPANFIFTEEEHKQIKEIGLKQDIDLDILSNKRKNEEEAAEKDCQMFEQDIKAKLSILRKDTETAINTQLTRMKDSYITKIRNAPIGEDKQRLLNEYEEAKTHLTENLKKEGVEGENLLNRKYEERKRKRDEKKMQCGINYEEDKLKREVACMLEKERKEDEIIQQKIIDAIIFSITNGHILRQNIPHVLDIMIAERNRVLEKNMTERHNHELLKSLANLYEKTFRDKFIQLSQLKEDYVARLKKLDELSINKKAYEAKMQSLLDKFSTQKDALNIKFENVEIEKENKTKRDLIEKHTEEKLKAAESIRPLKERILNDLFSKLPDFDPKMIRDGVSYFLKKAEENQAKEIDQIKEARRKELEKIEKEMAAENELALKAIEEKAKEELEAEAKEIDNNFTRQKNKLIEEHKNEMQDRLSKVNELNVEVRNQIISQYQKDIDALEAALMEERQSQLEKTKIRLLSKKIQKQRMKARAERRLKERNDEEQKQTEKIVIKPPEELKEFADADTNKSKPLLLTPSEVMQQERKTPSSQKNAIFINYRLQLRDWVERTKVDDMKVEEVKEDVVVKKAEKKKGKNKLEDNGGFVNFNELFEKIISCEDLIVNLNTVELPQIDEVISRLGDIMEALEKGKSLLTAQVKGIETMKYK